MLMRDMEIKAAIENGSICVNPFDARRLKGASYDLSLGSEALVSNRDEKVILSPGSNVSLQLNAGDFALVLTRESMKLPLDVTCTIGMRATLARMGLILLHGLQVDPGFEGHLRFGLYNASPRRITLDYADEICMVEFRKLAGPVDTPAPRIDALIDGKIPETDRQFLRTLETTSLSELGKTVQTLSKSVEALTNQIHRYVVPGIIGIFTAVIIAFICGIIKLFIGN